MEKFTLIFLSSFNNFFFLVYHVSNEILRAVQQSKENTHRSWCVRLNSWAVTHAHIQALLGVLILESKHHLFSALSTWSLSVIQSDWCSFHMSSSTIEPLQLRWREEQHMFSQTWLLKSPEQPNYVISIKTIQIFGPLHWHNGIHICLSWLNWNKSLYKWMNYDYFYSLLL